ncbi:MAG: hypothetical protein Dbin4_02682 [Alphaproteobacteria bacterium]|nr:hypothetical protein [Alphaproteobacteria bacterium]
MTTWNVNSELSLRNAIKQSSAGDTVLIQAGDYHIRMTENGRFDIKIDKSLNIVGNGGRANFYSDGHKVEKAIFNLDLDKSETVTFNKIGFFQAQSNDLNGSGIRQYGGNLVVKNSYFADSDSGILSITENASIRGNVSVSTSEFSKIGTNGYSHALYVLANSFTVSNNNIHDTVKGHHVKSLSGNTYVYNNILNDGNGTSSYAVDASAGGDLIIYGNTITQGVNGENRGVISYSAERHGGSAGDLIIQKNLINNLNGNPAGSKVLANATESEALILNNTINGFAENRLFSGLYLQQSNKLEGRLLGTYGTNNNAIMGTSGDDQMIVALTSSPRPVDSSAGHDTVLGSVQGDLIFSGLGNDFVFGDDGNDQIYGGGAADILLGGLHNDALFGQAGNDILFDSSGANQLWGGDGNDLIITRGADLIHGSPGDDIIINNGTLGGTYVGGDGNDILFGGLGLQSLWGGTGHDIAVYTGKFADYAVSKYLDYTLIKNIVGTGADTAGTEDVSAIEKIQFSDGYFDIAANSFVDSQYLLSLANLNAAIAIVSTLTDAGIEAAPQSSAPVLKQAYLTLYGSWDMA